MHIHLRLERSLFNNKKWSGPYHILENFDTELNTKNMMKVYYILSVSLLLMYVIPSTIFLREICSSKQPKFGYLLHLT